MLPRQIATELVGVVRAPTNPSGRGPTKQRRPVAGKILFESSCRYRYRVPGTGTWYPLPGTGTWYWYCTRSGTMSWSPMGNRALLHYPGTSTLHPTPYILKILSGAVPLMGPPRNLWNPRCTEKSRIEAVVGGVMAGPPMWRRPQFSSAFSLSLSPPSSPFLTENEGRGQRAQKNRREEGHERIKKTREGGQRAQKN